MMFFEHVGEFDVCLNAIVFKPKKINSLKTKSKKAFMQWIPWLQKNVEGKFPTAEIIVSNISNRITLFYNGTRINGWELYCLYRYNFVVYRSKKEDIKVQKWIKEHRYMNLMVKGLLSMKHDYRNNREYYCPLLAYMRELFVYYGINDEIPKHIQERNQCEICQNPEWIMDADEKPEYIEKCKQLHFELIKEWGKQPLNKEFFRISVQRRIDLKYQMYPKLRCSCGY